MWRCCLKEYSQVQGGKFTGQLCISVVPHSVKVKFTSSSSSSSCCSGGGGGDEEDHHDDDDDDDD